MFQNTALARTPTYKLILGFGLCTLGGALLYAYFKNRDEEEEESARNEPKSGTATAAKQQQQKEVTIKFAVSNQHVPLVVGRAGANLKVVEEKTQTSIKFSDKNDSHKTCEITGLPDAVKEARNLLTKEIERSPIIKEEIYVPHSACSKIMGRGGEIVQEICRQSLAKVSVEPATAACGSQQALEKRCITIIGNRQQVNVARKLIEDKIKEDEDLRRDVEEIELRREPRRSPTNSISSSIYSSQASLTSIAATAGSARSKAFNSAAGAAAMLAMLRLDETPSEVFVSAVASPARFWVQLIGPKLRELDELVEQMTAYYDEPKNRVLHENREPYLGQIVAALLHKDGKWYRGEIVRIMPNEFNPSEVLLDIYFVDYGDNVYVMPKEVYELRTDFLNLRFQAMECFLANVKSPLPDGEWSEEACEKFVEMAHASWKKLLSRTVTYKPRVTNTNGSSAENEFYASREGSPIPGLELYDPTESTELGIAEKLMLQGLALPLDDNQLRASSRYTSPATSIYEASQLTPQLENETTESAEDRFLQQQLNHLQKDNNTSVNGNGNTCAHAEPDAAAEAAMLCSVSSNASSTNGIRRHIAADFHNGAAATPAKGGGGNGARLKLSGNV